MTRRITRAGVIGSGVMGSGIAALLASVGVDTLLLDIVPPDLSDEERSDQDARNRFARTAVDRLVASRQPVFMHPRDAELISIGNLEDDFERLGGCDWIIEVALEDLAVKRDLLARIDAVRRPGSVVSTNTSGIPLALMVDGLTADLQANFLGTHFFNPVRVMHLLEIIPGPSTDASAIDFMTDFGRRVLGKGVVLAKDTPNFIANRIGVQSFVRATQLLLEHEMTVPEVDALLGPALGRPASAVFGTLDMIGIDTFIRVADNVHRLAEDDEYRDSLVIPPYVREMCDRGMLGDKGGGGFYRRSKGPDGVPVRLVLDPATLEYGPLEPVSFPSLERAKAAATLQDRVKALIGGDDRGARFAWHSLASHLVYAATLAPQIAESIVDVDAGMRWGYNFTLGPFEAWDAIGVADGARRMDETGFAVPANVREMLSEKRSRFYTERKGRISVYDFAQHRMARWQPPRGEVSLAALKRAGAVVFSAQCGSIVDLEDGVLFCDLRGSRKTQIGDVAALLAEGVCLAERDGVGLVVGADPASSLRGFWPGGELAELMGLAERGEFEELDAVLQLAQDGALALRHASIPVVVAPFGATTGLGCQLCLAGADRVVAHAELRMGLTDGRAGLPPAMGGCLGLWRRLCDHSDGSSACLDAHLALAVTTLTSGAVSTSAFEARSLGYLSGADRIVLSGDLLIGEAKKEVLRLVDDGYLPPAHRHVEVAGCEAGAVGAAATSVAEAAHDSDALDAALAQRIATVIGGGEVPQRTLVAEQVILDLERQAFIELAKQPETRGRAERLLSGGRAKRA